MKLRIGELAARSSVTVRTLRHYDQIGLLCPGERTDGDHRLYSEGEVRTLHQIQSLRTLGLSLEQIRGALQDPAHDPAQVLAAQIRLLKARLEREGALLERLKRLDPRGASWAELLEVIRMNEKVEKMLDTARQVGEQPRFDDEQLRYLEERREVVGEARLGEVEAEWPRLMAEVVREMEAGTPASDPRVLDLARRWQELVAEFTGGRQDIGGTLSDAYQGHMPPEMQAMWSYIGEAMGHLK
ncbi:MerR family transcriptional regulator [Deinococcus sp. MIMF12]|uniref:MerR family transcriptional regulator n=1 Tax=Deinococcus rhizophilus TaxID=3049544 RepID=A0ABT7JIQ6_9DEIO|nr:MerR family transcriptional regulator [Deinococcus rhizophilus]MDL2344328.1 MerR family transcriptional regulator [Deinococcus rhizophilus]